MVMGWAALTRHFDILNCKLPLSLTELVYDELFLLVMTYGAETWGLTKQLERKLKLVKPVTWFREQTGVEDILAQIMGRK